MMINRRGLITGLISLVAAPAIVRASSLMPIKAYHDDVVWGPVFKVTGVSGNIIDLINDDDETKRSWVVWNNVKVGDLVRFNTLYERTT